MESIGCASIAHSSDRTNNWLSQVYCGNLARGLKRRNVTNTIEKHSKGELFTELTCDEILAELRRFLTTHTHTHVHIRARELRGFSVPLVRVASMSRTRPLPSVRHCAVSVASPVGALELLPGDSR